MTVNISIIQLSRAQEDYQSSAQQAHEDWSGTPPAITAGATSEISIVNIKMLFHLNK
jgi:hypothetical protein